MTMRAVLFAMLAIALCAGTSTARVLQQSQAAAAAQAQAGATGSGEFTVWPCEAAATSKHMDQPDGTLLEQLRLCLDYELRSSCQSDD